MVQKYFESYCCFRFFKNDSLIDAFGLDSRKCVNWLAHNHERWSKGKTKMGCHRLQRMRWLCFIDNLWFCGTRGISCMASKGLWYTSGRSLVSLCMAPGCLPSRCFARVCQKRCAFCGSQYFPVIMCMALGRLASKCLTCVCQLALGFFGSLNFSF